jgi:hypothetical protein
MFKRVFAFCLLSAGLSASLYAAKPTVTLTVLPNSTVSAGTIVTLSASVSTVWCSPHHDEY